MKKLFNCNYEKITEKAFSQSLVISVLSILLCIVTLCSMTYAWFAEETASNSNTLISGSFDLDISVTYQSDGAATANTVKVTKGATDNVKTCTLDKIGIYTVVLSMSADSNVKGYCGVSVNGREEITAPISDDPEIGVKSLTFTITTTEENTTILFTPKWGYPSSSTIINNGAWPMGDSNGNKSRDK